jgi:hypothetical protein
LLHGADSPPIKAPDIPQTASKVSQSPSPTPIDSLDVLSIDQAYQSLYRPDLVREKLSGDTRGLVRNAASQLDLNKIIASGSAPAVWFTLLGREAGATTVESVNVSAQGEIAARGGGVGPVEWRINGVTVAIDRPAADAPYPLRLTRNLTLDPGPNRIELTAYNGADLVASLPSTLIVVAPQPAATEPGLSGTAVKPRLFAVVAGVNTYADPRIRLQLR